MALGCWVQVHDSHDGLVLVYALRLFGATHDRAEDASFEHELRVRRDGSDVSLELEDGTV
jgi:hypothetical protein